MKLYSDPSWDKVPLYLGPVTLENKYLFSNTVGRRSQYTGSLRHFFFLSFSHSCRMLSKDSWHYIAEIPLPVVSNNMFSFPSKRCQLCLHVCVSTRSLSKALWFLSMCLRVLLAFACWPESLPFSGICTAAPHQCFVRDLCHFAFVTVTYYQNLKYNTFIILRIGSLTVHKGLA